MTMVNVKLRKTIFLIWSLLTAPEKKVAKRFIGLSVIATLLEMLSLGMIIPLLYAFTTSQAAAPGIFGLIFSLPFVKNFNLTSILILLVSLFTIKNTFLIFLARYQAKFVFGIEESLSNKLYEIYLNQNYPFFLEKNSAELLRNVMREPSQFSHNALSPLCLLVTELFISVGVITLLVIVNPLAAISSMVLFGGFGYVFYFFVHRKISKWGKEHQFHEAKRLQNLQEGFGSIKEILIGSLQRKFMTAYAEHMRAGVDAGVNQQSVQSAPRLFIEIFAVSLLAGSIGFFSGADPVILLPIIGLYAAAAFRLLPGVNRVINALQSLSYSESTVHLLVVELARTQSLLNNSIRRQVFFNQKIELRNMSFRHKVCGPNLFKNMNLTIDVGDTILLTGPSGVGKTTLVDIICGLQIPTNGELLIDGCNVDGAVSGWQINIAYVPQTTFLIDGTIKENIIFGLRNQDVSTSHLEKVCQIAKVDEIINALPDGIDSSVGERGGNLSGGQRQRIGIARALYRGGKLLVLDEATNALDHALEAAIMKEIISHARENQITTICIAHNSKFLPLGYKKIELTSSGYSIEHVS